MGPQLVWDRALAHKIAKLYLLFPLLGGGIYVNNLQVREVNQPVTLENSIAGQFLVLRQGRNTYYPVRLKGTGVPAMW